MNILLYEYYWDIKENNLINMKILKIKNNMMPMQEDYFKKVDILYKLKLHGYFGKNMNLLLVFMENNYSN